LQTKQLFLAIFAFNYISSTEPTADIVETAGSGRTRL